MLKSGIKLGGSNQNLMGGSQRNLMGSSQRNMNTPESALHQSKASIIDIDYVLTDDECGGDPCQTIPSLPESHIMSRIHTLCGAVVHDDIFKKAMFGLIIANSILLAIATFDFVKHDPQVYLIFEIIDTVFLSVFTLELALNFGFYGPNFFSDGWLVFDFIVVTLSWAFEALAVFRAFRIVRTFRVITKMKEMKDLVAALLSVMPRMFAIFLLLLLIYFVFAVMFTEMFKEAYAEGYTSQDYFSRLDRTTFTLLQLMFLDNWAVITKELMHKVWWAWIPILGFIIISTFIVVNLIIAVICDAVAAIQTGEVSKHVDEMQNVTADVMQQNEVIHREEIARLERKIDQITTLLANTISQEQGSRTMMPMATNGEEGQKSEPKLL